MPVTRIIFEPKSQTTNPQSIAVQFQSKISTNSAQSQPTLITRYNLLHLLTKRDQDGCVILQLK